MAVFLITLMNLRVPQRQGFFFVRELPCAVDLAREVRHDNNDLRSIDVCITYSFVLLVQYCEWSER